MLEMLEQRDEPSFSLLTRRRRFRSVSLRCVQVLFAKVETPAECNSLLERTRISLTCSHGARVLISFYKSGHTSADGRRVGVIK